MSCAFPVFITQNRFGTYYFRCRIPQRLKTQYQSNKSEVTRSLKTKDYRTAVNSARRLWVLMMDNDFYLAGHVNVVESAPVPPQVKPEPFVSQSNFHEKYRNNRPLDEVVDMFCDENRPRWNVNYESKEFRPLVQLLIEIIGNKSCSSVEVGDIVRFKDAYVRLPKNRKKVQKYRKKSVKELQEMNVPDEDRLSLATIKKSFNILISFILWCADNHYLRMEIAKPLQRYNKNHRRDHAEYEERDPFTDGDLKRLFGSEEYLSKKHKKSSEYWIPLLAVHTGARLRELYQLRKEDIRFDSESGVHYLDINNDGDTGKSLKTKSSKRKIPIHNKLIELGFLKYVESVPRGRALFAEIQTDSVDQLTRYFSKWFGRYRKRCNVGVIKGEKKTFHSFRHYVCNYMKSKEVNLDLIEEIVGHSNKNVSETRSRYTLPYELNSKMEAISLINMSDIIDFGKIKLYC